MATEEVSSTFPISLLNTEIRTSVSNAVVTVSFIAVIRHCDSSFLSLVSSSAKNQVFIVF